MMSSVEREDLDLAELHKVRVFDGAQPKLSRRGLFGTLRQATTNKLEVAVNQTVEALQPARSIPVDERLPQRIPPSRMRLLQQLATLPILADPVSLPEQAPFAEVEINGQLCSACGLCARFCPSGALQFNEKGESFDLRFRAATCIGCNICVVACPEDAMALENLTQPAKLLHKERRTLAHGVLTACDHCGAPAAVREIDETRILCYACRGVGRISPSQEGADLLDNLFKGLPGG